MQPATPFPSTSDEPAAKPYPGPERGQMPPAQLAADADPMRREYRRLTSNEMYSMDRFKQLGHEFYTELDLHGSSRELSIAKTKIEEAVMWAVKHVTK